MSAKSQSLLPDLLTGLFVAAVVALLGFFTIVISGVDLFRGRRDVVREAVFERVGALREQDPVTVRGMKVGAVRHLRLARDRVVVTFAIDASIPLREDASASVASTSVLGGACLELDQGVADGPLPEGARVRGLPPQDVMRELGALVGELREAFDPRDVRALIVNLRGASADLAEISSRVRGGQGLVGRLLSPDDTTYAALEATLDNARRLSDDLAAVSADLRQGKGLLGQLLREDSSTYDDLKETLANLRAATAALNDPRAPLGRLLSGGSPLMADLEATAANLRDVSRKLNDGHGTLGRLVNDRTLADEAEATIKDVRQIIDNMRDTAPITSFTSLFFGGL